MPEPGGIGRLLLGAGLLLALVGLLLIAGERVGLPLGRLPGDIRVDRGPVTVFAPLMSCLLLSVVLTILANLALWLLRR